MKETRTQTVRVVQVVETRTLVGEGTDQDPYTTVTEYWSFEGQRLGLLDPREMVAP